MSQKITHANFGSTEYRVFGKLVEVKEDDDYLMLVNEKGEVRRMAKRYYATWKQRKERAEELLNCNVLTRFGGGGMSTSFSSLNFFNEIIMDSSNINGGILDTPPDAGREAHQEIVQLRIHSQLSDYHRSKRASTLELGLDASKEQLENLKEHVNRLEQERLAMSRDQKLLVRQSERALIMAWPDWRNSPKQAFIIPKGTANKPRHVHKAFMLKYGLDITKRSRLDVTLTDKGRDNYVHCTLDDYDDMPCTLALIKPQGQWEIASAEPQDPVYYYKFAKRVLPENGKDANEPLAWFEEQHKIIYKRIEQSVFQDPPKKVAFEDL